MSSRVFVSKLLLTFRLNMSTSNLRFVGPAVGNLSSVENAHRLNSLRFGLNRAMELCAALTLLEPDTINKINLCKELWRFSCLIELVRKRLAELGDHRDFEIPSNELYLDFTNRIFNCQHEERKNFFYMLIVPDLLNAVRTYIVDTRSVCDNPTEIILVRIEADLTNLVSFSEKKSSVLSSSSFSELKNFLEEIGGVLGLPARPLSKDIKKTVDIPVYPDISNLVVLPARENILEIQPRVPRPSIINKKVEFLHTLAFGIEVCAAEICCQIILENRNAPWGLRFDMARQAWDEMRHAESLLIRVEELGGVIGMYPIDQEIWMYFRTGESLVEQLMIEQRLGEGQGLDGCLNVYNKLIDLDDLSTALIFDYIMADEVNHVERGNYWIRYLLKGNEVAIQSLEARTRIKLLKLGLDLSVPIPVNVRGRRLAGFTDEEISKCQTAEFDTQQY